MHPIHSESGSFTETDALGQKLTFDAEGVAYLFCSSA